jgi:hypothetical protein
LALISNNHRKKGKNGGEDIEIKSETQRETGIIQL